MFYTVPSPLHTHNYWLRMILSLPCFLLSWTNQVQTSCRRQVDAFLNVGCRVNLSDKGVKNPPFSGYRNEAEWLWCKEQYVSSAVFISPMNHERKRQDFMWTLGCEAHCKAAFFFFFLICLWVLGTQEDSLFCFTQLGCCFLKANPPNCSGLLSTLWLLSYLWCRKSNPFL